MFDRTRFASDCGVPFYRIEVNRLAAGSFCARGSISAIRY
jgi:hypothetical protein